MGRQEKTGCPVTYRLQQADSDRRRGTDDDFVYINFSRLLDGERNSTSDRRRRNPHLLHPLDNLRFVPGFVMEFARFVWTNPGETLVTRSLSPASCRKVSVM